MGFGVWASLFSAVFIGVQCVWFCRVMKAL